MSIEHQIRLLQASQAPEYEEIDPKLPRWQNGALWYGGFALCLGTLFLAGEGMWMALEALHG